MLGAVIGDLFGSIYEYEQTIAIKNLKVNKGKILKEAFFSDDSILTMAILNAILNKKAYEESLKEYANKYRNYKPDFKPYFQSSFSPSFMKWLDDKKPRKSAGNGALMRISPVGYLFNTEDEVKTQARLATIPSHNNQSAIDAAELVALIIFWKRSGLSKEEIKLKVEEKHIISFKEFKKFNTSAKQTLPNVLYALFNTEDFESSINKVISFGGDTDTNATIVASMAEAFYGVPDELEDWAKKQIPNDFLDLLDKGYSKIKKIK